MWPLILCKTAQCMRGVFKNVVCAICFSAFDLSDLFTNNLKSVTKSVKLEFILRFSRFNHEASDNWPAHCRSVEAEVHQAFGNVFFSDTCSLFEATAVEDELVGNSSFIASEDNLEIIFESFCYVIGIEDGNLGRLCQACLAEKLDKRIADRQNATIAVRSGCHSSVFSTSDRGYSVTWDERL